MTPAQLTARLAAWLATARGWLAWVRKFLSALVGYVTALLSLGILPDEWAGYVAAVLGALGTLGVGLAANAPRPVPKQAVSNDTAPLPQL